MNPYLQRTYVGMDMVGLINTVFLFLSQKCKVKHLEEIKQLKLELQVSVHVLIVVNMFLVVCDVLSTQYFFRCFIWKHI